MSTVEAVTELWAFLDSKPRPRLIGKQCTNRRPAWEAHGLEGYRPTSGELVRCGRPVWGDGQGVRGQGEGLCSRCWHEHNAFHGAYTTMTANPAASLLSGSKIEQMSDLFGGNELPAVGAERPDTFPEDWC